MLMRRCFWAADKGLNASGSPAGQGDGVAKNGLLDGGTDGNTGDGRLADSGLTGGTIGGMPEPGLGDGGKDELAANAIGDQSVGELADANPSGGGAVTGGGVGVNAGRGTSGLNDPSLNAGDADRLSGSGTGNPGASNLNAPDQTDRGRSGLTRD